MEQARSDEDFLRKLTSDILAEMADCIQRIRRAINDENFSGIMKAAHQLWGSASYLMLKDLQTCANALQDLALEGMLIGEIDESGNKKKWHDSEPRESKLLLTKTRENLKVLLTVMDKVKRDIVKQYPD